MIYTLTAPRISDNLSSQIFGYVYGGNGVRVQSYAHPQQMKVLKHLLYVGYGCGMQFERFYSLNHSIVP
jgi:hypothetical protein